jgi:hypothetical protein
MIVLAMGVGLYSLNHGFKRHHHQKLPMVIFIGGMIFLLLKQVLHAYQLWLLIPGVSMIIAAHYLNYRQCQKANHCHKEDCAH